MRLPSAILNKHVAHDHGGTTRAKHTRRKEATQLIYTLSFVDDCYSARVGDNKVIDGGGGRKLGNGMGQKYRVQKMRAAWGMIKRLTRLPPREKAKVVVGQPLPMLPYGAELHDTPWDEGARLVSRL